MVLGEKKSYLQDIGIGVFATRSIAVSWSTIPETLDKNIKVWDGPRTDFKHTIGSENSLLYENYVYQ